MRQIIEVLLEEEDIDTAVLDPQASRKGPSDLCANPLGVNNLAEFSHPVLHLLAGLVVVF